MNGIGKDILVGALFIAGTLSFLSGLFIVSTVLFAATSMFSNMSTTARIKG
ncbi:hypothetical protein [Methylomonas rhizoryzae]|uniref:hypothetical protein n=1 Tax=Methylomonas rhizoryzae TaxID=2608981 RepID=UPI00167FE773|nr:hypothetical protein [Methylomonas rhizoryzae]